MNSQKCNVYVCVEFPKILGRRYRVRFYSHEPFIYFFPVDFEEKKEQRHQLGGIEASRHEHLWMID